MLASPVPRAMQLSSFSGGCGGGRLMSPFRSPETTKPGDAAPADAPKQRPKLSLNTSNISSNFSFKSSSLRLDTLSVVSPTSRNTLHNGYSSHHSQPSSSSTPSDRSSGSDTKTPTPRDSAQSPPKTQFLPPQSIGKPENAATALLSRTDPPAAQPTSDIRRSSTQCILRPIISSSRERSPERRRKSVAFRPQLTETIHTNTYTLAHSDLLGAPDADTDHTGVPSPTMPLPQRMRSQSTPNVRLSKNEARWRTAIESAEAEAEAVEVEVEVEVDDGASDECLNRSGKRNSPTQPCHNVTNSDSCISTSDSKRRRRAAHIPHDGSQL